MTDAPTTPDPVEMAMAAEASGRTPEGVAARVLEGQARLIRWQVARERAALAVTVGAGLAGLSVAVLLGAMVWRAAQADGVVVRPFTTPADLAADGLTGEALAARVLDRIETLRLQSGWTLKERASGFKSADDQGLRLEIPQTGISIGEVDAYLRRWLGHERAITGALTRMGETVTLTVRYSSEPAIAVSGPAAELDRVISEAADEVFAQADPIHSVLAQPITPAGHDRVSALLARVRAGRTLSERQFGYSFSANQTPDLRQALAYHVEAERLEPGGNTLNYRERVFLMTALGRWEAALRAAADGAKVASSGKEIWTPGGKAWVNDQLTASRAVLTGDFGAAEQALWRMHDPKVGVYRQRRNAAPLIAAQHDIGRARAEIARLEGLGLPVSADDRARVALHAGDWAAATQAYAAAKAELDAEDATWRAAGWPQSMRGRDRRIPFIAEHAGVLAEAGDLAGASAMIQPTPADCYPCLITRARIAWLGGDLAGAEALYGRAAGLGPSLPHAHEAWARLALARGQFARAVQLARIAEARGPRWADPLKVEGDALAADGDRKAALARYDAALRLAPAWAEAKAARARAGR